MHQDNGWTLVELVLTLSLVSITASALVMSLYKPLIWSFDFAENMRVFHPFYLAAEEIRQDLTPLLKNIELHPHENTLSIFYPNNASRIYQCNITQTQLYKYEKNQKGILLSDVICSFLLIPDEKGWLVEITFASGDNATAIKRVFYARKT